MDSDERKFLESIGLEKIEKWKTDLNKLEKAEEMLKAATHKVDEKCDKAIAMARDEAGNIREDD